MLLTLEAEHAAALLRPTTVQRAVADHGPGLVADGDLGARLDIVIAAGSLAVTTVCEEVVSLGAGACDHVPFLGRGGRRSRLTKALGRGIDTGAEEQDHHEP
jgi:hypothetical protein